MIYSFCLVFKDHPRSQNWTLDFEPAFSQRFYFPLSPRSLFHTRQRFPILKHVTSGSHEPAILFSHWSAVSHSKTRDFRLQALPVTSGSGDVIDLLSTNQKPPYATYGRPLLLTSKPVIPASARERNFTNTAGTDVKLYYLGFNDYSVEQTVKFFPR